MKQTSNNDVSVDTNTRLCVCGKKLAVMLASQCYDGNGVACDRCKTRIPNSKHIHHCLAKKKNTLHTNGYDLCYACFMETSGEINMDSVLFEIWFIINKLNKTIYYKMKSEYEIISIKSLMSKSTYHVLKMVKNIDWNNDENVEFFFSKYDKLKDDFLSLENQQKMDEMKHKVDKMSMQMEKLERRARDAQRQLQQEKDTYPTNENIYHRGSLSGHRKKPSSVP